MINYSHLTPWQLQINIVCWLIFTWHGIMSIVMIKIFFIDNKNGIDTKILRNLAISFNIFACIAFFFGAFCASFPFLSSPWIISYILFAVFLYSTVTALYLIFILRLVKSFEGSVFQVKNRLLILYYTLLFTLGIIKIFAFILYPLQYFTSFIILLSSGIVIIMFVNIHIAYIFYKNLFLLVLQQRQSIFVKKDMEKRESVELNHSQLSMINAITKHTLIVSIGIIGFGLSLIISAIVNLFTYYINNGFATGLITFAWSLVPAIIILSLLTCLEFKATERWYKICCWRCNASMKRCCIDLAERRIAKTNGVVVAQTSVSTV